LDWIIVDHLHKRLVRFDHSGFSSGLLNEFPVGREQLLVPSVFHELRFFQAEFFLVLELFFLKMLELSILGKKHAEQADNAPCDYKKPGELVDGYPVTHEASLQKTLTNQNLVGPGTVLRTREVPGLSDRASIDRVVPEHLFDPEKLVILADSIRA